MTSKKIIALLLTVCMILSCIPAFAATIELKGDAQIPEEGLSVSARRTIWEGITVGKTARNVLIILNADSSKNFPYRSSANHYDGVALSFTATCKSEVIADGITTFTVVNAPAGYTRADGQGDACFGITPADLIAHSPELSALGENVFGFTLQEGPFDISNLVIKKGTWAPEAVNVGAFTEGTFFLSHQGFYTYPSTWPQETRTGLEAYGSIIYKSSAISNDGPYQFFIPEKDGEYNVWVQMISNNGDLNNRAVDIAVNGKALNFNPSVIESSKLPTAMAPLWVPEKQGLTVSFKAGELVAVNLLPVTMYGRCVSIAFVPVADNEKVSAEILQSPTTRQIEPADVVAASAKAFHPAYDTSSVSVTIDGVTVQPVTGAAAKKVSSGSGYITGPSARVFAFPVRILPDTNTFPTYATVADAIAQLIYKKQVIDGSTQPIVDIRNLKNGVFTDKSVLVNGVVVKDIDWHPIKNGDVITFEDKNNNTKSTFEPVSVGNLFSVIGGYSAPAGMTDMASKFCLSKNNLKASALKNVFAEADLLNTDNASDVGLKGCHIVGYVAMNSTAASAGISPDSKVYFENVNILGYNVGQGSDRVDLLIDKITYLTTDTEKSKVQDATGKYYHDPYGLVTRGTHYDNYSNLYIMNSSISDTINVIKTSPASYILTTDGMQLVTTVVVTYAEDGSIATTEILNDRMVMFNEPLGITVAANQKVYVWKSKALAGTTMVPATDVLLGANFLN